MKDDTSIKRGKKSLFMDLDYADELAANAPNLRNRERVVHYRGGAIVGSSGGGAIDRVRDGAAHVIEA